MTLYPMPDDSAASPWHTLIAIRELSGISQAGLARSCGMTRQQLNAYETGKKLAGKTVEARIARALNVNVMAIARQRVA